jgi:hypothetical protein
MRHGSRKVVGDMGAKRGNKDVNKTSESCKPINQRSYCCPKKVTGSGRRRGWKMHLDIYVRKDVDGICNLDIFAFNLNQSKRAVCSTG